MRQFFLQKIIQKTVKSKGNLQRDALFGEKCCFARASIFQIGVKL